MTPDALAAPVPNHPTNEVRLIGRLGAMVHDRELPSGDLVSTFTVIVDRPRLPRSGTSRVRVDAVPCQVFRASLRDRLSRLDEGDVVEVEGAIRRRFWRAPGGLGSAIEVDVSRIRRMR